MPHLLFQDDQNRDLTELTATPREEVETHRQEEKYVDVAVKETPTTQVLDKALYTFILESIFFQKCF